MPRHRSPVCLAGIGAAVLALWALTMDAITLQIRWTPWATALLLLLLCGCVKGRG